jgi:hypothetical protein
VRILALIAFVVFILSVLAAGCGAPDGTSPDPGSGPTGDPGGNNLSGSPAQPTPPSGNPSKPPPATDPCASASLGDGAYCGSTIGGDAGALYDCQGGKTASKTVCPMGCQTNPAGVADACKDDNAYHLPWKCGVTYPVTQGNNGDICGSNGGDHTGVQAYAWDFGLPRHTPVLASRGGIVTVAANVTSAGQNCYDGCTQPFGTSAFWTCCNACINTSNHVNVQHADGTVATYWHLDVATVKVGDHVNAGDPLGYSGTSGCSSGPHLHFMNMGNCPTGYCQSVSMKFQEAGIPACGAQVKSTDGC